MRGLLSVASFVAICLSTSTGDACPIDASPYCPCGWDINPIPVYALTQGAGADRLQNLNPSRSPAEWEQIITNAINIYRENSGVPRRFYFAGHTSNYFIGGAVVVRAKVVTSPSDGCEAADGYTHLSISIFDWDEIEASNIEIFSGFMRSNACQTITWDPRLLAQTNPSSAPWNRDPVNLLVHELGHVLGLDHPTECSEDVAAIMNPGQIWGRHLTRNDRQSLISKYGAQQPTGKVRNFSLGTWGAASNWVVTLFSYPFTRPGSVTSPGGNKEMLIAWEKDGSGNAATASNRFDSTWALHQTLTGATWNPISMVYGGTHHARAYFFDETATGTGINDRKKLCYRESTDGGSTWGATVCPDLPGITPPQPIRSRRDGIAVAFDWYTKNYIVLYNDDVEDPANQNWCNPVAPDYAHCNRIMGLTMPGPGSTLTTNKLWTIGHHSFSPPSIACRRGSTSAARCMIAFSTEELAPHLRWPEGGLIASGASEGIWSMSADRFQTSILVDQSPSVAWSTVDAKFHLVTHRRYGTTSEHKTFNKPQTAGATWTAESTTLYTSGSVSAAVLGTTNTNPVLRMYYLQYAE
jgi:hypothetical protein